MNLEKWKVIDTDLRKRSTANIILLKWFLHHKLWIMKCILVYNTPSVPKYKLNVFGLKFVSNTSTYVNLFLLTLWNGGAHFINLIFNAIV